MSRAWPFVLALCACGGRAVSLPDAARDAALDAASDASVTPDVATPTDADVDSATPADGRCTTDADTQSDPENCGACGARCAATGSCRGGTCRAVPMLEQQARAPGCKRLHVAVESGDLYWTDQGGGEVLRAAKGGGAPTVVASGEDQPYELAVGGGQVFWLVGTPNPSGGQPSARSIRVAPAAGGAATTVLAVPEGIGGFTASPDGETVYFSTQTVVRRVERTGSGATDVARESRGWLPRGLALYGTRLAFAEDLSGWIHLVELRAGEVAVCGLSDPVTTYPVRGPCTRPISDNGSLLREAIVLEAGLVFWADGSALKSWDPATPGYRFPLTYVSSDSVSISAMTGAVKKIFLATSDRPMNPGTGTIVEVAAEPVGAPALEIARAQKDPRSIAADAARVYWSDADCAIWSVAP